MGEGGAPQPKDRFLYKKKEMWAGTHGENHVKTEAESGDRQLGPGTPGTTRDQWELKEAGRGRAPAPPARAGHRHLDFTRSGSETVRE